jgi:hypothetical protein
VRALAQARAERHLGDVAPHFFSFGGLLGTARWAEAVAQRRIALEAGDGFRVEPPGAGVVDAPTSARVAGRPLRGPVAPEFTLSRE